MEKESFEDEEVAQRLNEHFVSIKVDREERPDIDHIYMTVCQVLTGQGGWPLTIFMTPDRKPFYAGTYLPKNDHRGMPGLMSLLERVNNAWKNNKDTLLDSGEKITEAIEESGEAYHDEISKEIIHEAFTQFKYDFDNTYGGFGSAPKFPTPHNLFFLLRYWYITGEPYALEMVEKTLDSMNRGGIYDHIGFGFCRYSTDRKWLVPHFEKMLYDNALLAMAYLETFQATRDQKYARVAEEIFEYILRDMTSAEGGFFSAEDADSEGIEGKFYVWSPEEIKNILGDEDGRKFCELFDITTKGNFEGLNIPNLIKGSYPDSETEFVNSSRQKLFESRARRIHPYKDDKILTAWNGMMIAAMAIGGRILNKGKYTSAAERALSFIFDKLIREDNRLMARYRDGEAAFPGYVDDYAFLVWGLIELYGTTYNPQYLEKALQLNGDLLKYFWDNEKGGLFIYGSDSEKLISRPKEIYDGATPSGNSVSALNFLRLARLTGNHQLEEKADQMFKTFGSSIERVPRGHSFFLTAYMFWQAKTKEVVLVGENGRQDMDSMIDILRDDFRPFTVTMVYSDITNELKRIAPFVENYRPIGGEATAYICENFACQAPITDREVFKQIIERH